jgi:hypothetical protein
MGREEESPQRVRKQKLKQLNKVLDSVKMIRKIPPRPTQYRTEIAKEQFKNTQGKIDEHRMFRGDPLKLESIDHNPKESFITIEE